ncbi:MAG: ABC transporter permease, partial [Candidatus Woesearchaeota archaeon]
MKVFKVTAKNLKLLMRSKTSMLVIVFGPLIIMLLVGFAFNNNAVSKLNIGYYASDNSSLTESFISALKENPNFIIIAYPSDSQCVDMIQQGKVHLCIIFPSDFRIENNKSNELQFYVDQSRANFVYAVIDTVSTKVSVASTQLSYQMTNDLITVIDHTKRSNAEQLSRIDKIKSSITSVSTMLDTVQSNLDNIDFSDTKVDTKSVESISTTLQTDVDSLQSEANNLVQQSRNAVKDWDSQTDNDTLLKKFDTVVKNANVTITNSYDVVSGDITGLADNLDKVSAGITLLSQKLSQAKSATGDSSKDMEDNMKALSEVKTSIDELKALIDTNTAQIDALKVTSAQSIVNPIKTTIKPVSTKSGNLNFIFPYFIVLIIVFICIMLSSNIIIMEKTSKAYFRNFTTPTKDTTFVMSVFLTSFIVVILQLALILGLAYLFLNTTLFTNMLLTALLIVASVSLFTLVGMVIGYLFNNQEAVTMASISFGSAFIF